MAFDHIPDYEDERAAAYRRVMERHHAEKSHRRPTDKELYGEMHISKPTFYRWEHKRLDALPPDIVPPPPPDPRREQEEGEQREAI
jgi:hypothetical protein